MSRNVLKIACILCLIALIACGALILGNVFHIGLRYANAEKYAAGAATVEGAVKNLDIHWKDGSVKIAYHDKDTVEISETSPKAIPDKATLRWWLDGDTLRVQYAKSGFFSFWGQKKALTVTLPEGTAITDLGIDVTSGEIDLDQPTAVDSVRLACTSGDIRAALPDVKALAIEATSGDIQASFKSADSVSLSTTSGEIDAEGESAGTAKVDCTSGDIRLHLDAFDELRIDTTSGDVTAALPTEPGYRARVTTTSGSFNADVPLSKDGNEYLCGDGSGRVEIHVTSGDVRLTEE